MVQYTSWKYHCLSLKGQKDGAMRHFHAAWAMPLAFKSQPRTQRQRNEESIFQGCGKGGLGKRGFSSDMQSVALQFTEDLGQKEYIALKPLLLDPFSTFLSFGFHVWDCKYFGLGVSLSVLFFVCKAVA